jgi:hypothetical protein
MTFNRKITLISSEQKNGSQGKTDRAVKAVYAKVSRIRKGFRAWRNGKICRRNGRIQVGTYGVYVET